MSVALTESIDLLQVASSGQRIAEQVSLAQLPRLVEALDSLGAQRTDEAGTTVDCRLELSCDSDGTVRIRGRLGTRWSLVCQRCLESFVDPVSLRVNWRSGTLPDGDFELGDEPVRLIDWVEDELLLALPPIPKHRDRKQCGQIARDYLVATEEAPLRKPFADLKNMLNDRRD
jgi:uncharacterized protein